MYLVPAHRIGIDVRTVGYHVIVTQFLLPGVVVEVRGYVIIVVVVVARICDRAILHTDDLSDLDNQIGRVFFISSFLLVAKIFDKQVHGNVEESFLGLFIVFGALGARGSGLRHFKIAAALPVNRLIVVFAVEFGLAFRHLVKRERVFVISGHEVHFAESKVVYVRRDFVEQNFKAL